MQIILNGNSYAVVLSSYLTKQNVICGATKIWMTFRAHRQYGSAASNFDPQGQDGEHRKYEDPLTFCNFYIRFAKLLLHIVALRKLIVNFSA